MVEADGLLYALHEGVAVLAPSEPPVPAATEPFGEGPDLAHDRVPDGFVVVLVVHFENGVVLGVCALTVVGVVLLSLVELAVYPGDLEGFGDPNPVLGPPSEALDRLPAHHVWGEASRLYPPVPVVVVLIALGVGVHPLGQTVRSELGKGHRRQHPGDVGLLLLEAKEVEVLFAPLEEQTAGRGRRTGGVGQFVVQNFGPSRRSGLGELAGEKYVGPVGKPLGAQRLGHLVDLGALVHTHSRDRHWDNPTRRAAWSGTRAPGSAASGEGRRTGAGAVREMPPTGAWPAWRSSGWSIPAT